MTSPDPVNFSLSNMTKYNRFWIKMDFIQILMGSSLSHKHHLHGLYNFILALIQLRQICVWNHHTSRDYMEPHFPDKNAPEYFRSVLISVNSFSLSCYATAQY